MWNKLLSSFLRQLIERGALVLVYAETLKAWRARFEANRERVREIYDERFCRMWTFSLAPSELAFRYGGHVVF